MEKPKPYRLYFSECPKFWLLFPTCMNLTLNHLHKCNELIEFVKTFASYKLERRTCSSRGQLIACVHEDYCCLTSCDYWTNDVQNNKKCKFMLMALVQHNHYFVVTCNLYISNLQIAMLNSDDACYFHLRCCNQFFCLNLLINFPIQFVLWSNLNIKPVDLLLLAR